ncbi:MULTISPECIES: 2-oxo acid dehydrogenase subunit E2 [Rhodococcus]|jgi:2-oxoglutarate dehydrogenase E2 component (dihydrolipoamide succinyltransferase)|uniref:Dihydrolipoamide acetyltransferase component of pyruvate dehydrogenase complex n=1 Tax=Rhodococcus opacus TaxID=37919 RepID=A0AAX3YUI3_RHOOP|nr:MULTISPECIES: 2-oxo acid dehydrogenase subunit E2 [Rhodococcus]MCZ4585979.1 2-oxo acid dehydrogenase subunit E2 [Rhodococcus opacus]PBC51395.1 dihydrolipoyllysine succinyltransferase [Rhodococcus sp. ACPA1]WLF52066.1 2-oxo acid dehydrogenase subunit E2 [Rhodococcus opacus]
MTTTQTGTTVVLPSLGENVTEATITRWLKTPGDHIEQDEPLLEVATDKVDTEVPSPAAGTLLEIIATEDAVVEVGAALAVLSAQGSDTQDTPAPAAEATPAPAPTAATSAPARAPVSNPTTPEAAALSAAGDRVEKLPRIRRTIAQRMLESLQTSAQLTTVLEVDVTEISRLRNREKEDFHRRTGVKLSFLPFFVAAAVDALAEHPVINSSLDADCTEVTYHGAVHLGMAVDSDKGLMVPVIRDADTLPIPELARAVADSAASVRTGTIRPDDLSGGTFTITNTGSRGALFDTPIINQPQSAILGIGAVVERLVPTLGDGGALQINVKSMAYLSLSYDHRIVDGADAARYLATVRQRLEDGFDPSDLQ